MVWCNYTRKINVKFFWGEKDILRGEKNLSMKSLHIIWFDIRIYKVVCSTNGNVLNKKFWPWVRICFIPCCWFHIHTWVHTPIQMLSSQHSLNMTLTWFNSLILCQLLFFLRLQNFQDKFKTKSCLFRHTLISPRAINTSFWELRSSEYWDFLSWIFLLLWE